jgi:hypothetical protein
MAKWIDPGEPRTLSTEERAELLVDLLLLSDALPPRRRTELTFPRLRDLRAGG